MKSQHMMTFSFLVLVSLTLAGCGAQPDVAIVDPVDTAQIEIVQEVQAPAVIKDAESSTQTITASEVVYPAKVWDTVEAHPAWLTVTVTLEDDTITWLDIDQESSSPKSARHQAQFAWLIEAEVIGKKLSESNAVYFSAASSTSQAFNDSINEIQDIVASAS